MSVPPNRPPASDRIHFSLPRGWKFWAAVAFGIGLLLFGLVWWDKRDDGDFYRVGAPVDRATGQEFEPLPEPLPAGGDTAAIEDAPPPEAPIVEPVETPSPAPLPPPVPPPPVAVPAPPPPPAPIARVDSNPVPISAPAPRYPPEARRRGESGKILLGVQVGADGEPGQIDVLQSSGSRMLDRAAIDGVRRWRFQPAMARGQPVPGRVMVPIDFRLQQ